MIHEVTYHGIQDGQEVAQAKVGCIELVARAERGDQEWAFLQIVRELNVMELTGYAAPVNFPELSGYLRLTKGE